ncbi:hypothetical protein IX329_001661 [Fusobacterium necrophorum]|nr:IS200/IS605 family transposase [Fusobacterium necrophorum subsp. necrophorum]MBR8734055.1 hypothetical protein [Fusobacterium necrophorum]MBR8790231.1 hypothetical protein [Fusobacterium necrophorum]SDB36759.1 Helix-turn-helix domain-containing protein [Fusobacterium necrophorum]SQD10307.1 Transposase and inactivated derivatives [Fusobacterium necrophorum subsp. necrophorum]
MELDSNYHSVFLLCYHLVLVVKYRRKVFDDTISEFAKDMFVRIGVPYHITLVQWNHDKDHVHIMFKAHPKTELTKFIKDKRRNHFEGDGRMRQLKAYKFRMYPNEEQKIFFTTEISTQVKIYWRKI